MKDEIKKDLFKLADEKYKQFQSNLCPNTNNIIGVRVPILRNYAKDLYKKYQFDELLKNIDNEYYEEIMLQGMIIGLAKKEKIEKIQKAIEDFIPKIDNWAICDVFCSGLKIVKDYKPQMWDFIQKYLKSKKEFEIRFAVVIMLEYYIEEEYVDEILKKLDTTKHEGYYVKMAVAWALSICLIKFYDKTIKYLKISKIDNFTYNKALQKARESYRLTQEEKEYIKKLYKK